MTRHTSLFGLTPALSLMLFVGCGPTGTGGDPDAGENQNDAQVQPDSSLPPDRDGDGVPDDEDPCPDDVLQWTDSDDDGHCDELDDRCPSDPSQWTDADGDGHCDEVDDQCPSDPNQWTDADGDGHCDEVDDQCPSDPSQWTDADGDGHCDELDDDCPTDPAGWDDTNGDGLCDGDDDSDGDGISNGEELIYGADCAISDPYSADSDGDGIGDNHDPYPLDPFPEYILHRNDNGTIDLSLSNRDGTFQAPVEIGAAHGCTTDAPHNCPVNTAYRYVSFVITDFDSNGRTDFLAIGDADPANATNSLDLWFFTRSGTIISGNATTFQQRLVDAALAHALFGTAADFNNDDRIDLIALEITKPDYISAAYYYSYENTGLLPTATCAVTEDPTNPNGCAFVRRLAANLNPLAAGEWSVGTARDSVDVDGDGFRDLTFYTMSSGGNVAIPVYILTGNGDGTFDVPSTPMFSHNSSGCGASPANSIVFGDFDGDELGDVIIGLDDDGDPGSAWFYKGISPGGVFAFDFANCFESFDINPEESGADRPGATGAVRPFDFDFDGNLDIMLGWRSQSATAPPTETILLLGDGDGTFAAPIQVRAFPTSDYGTGFATPQRLCARFPITSP